MAFVMAFYEKLTAGELAFLSASYMVIAALAVATVWPAAYLRGSNWLEPWRTNRRNIVVIAPDPVNPGKTVFHDLGDGVHYDMDTLTLPPKGYVTTRDRVAALTEQAESISPLAKPDGL